MAFRLLAQHRSAGGIDPRAKFRERDERRSTIATLSKRCWPVESTKLRCLPSVVGTERERSRKCPIQATMKSQSQSRGITLQFPSSAFRGWQTPGAIQILIPSHISVTKQVAMTQFHINNNAFPIDWVCSFQIILQKVIDWRDGWLLKSGLTAICLHWSERPRSLVPASPHWPQGASHNPSTCSNCDATTNNNN
jgi:hypothetical protein